MEIGLTRHAKRQLAKLPRDIQQRIIAALDRAATIGHPRPRRLQGSKVYRLRVGDYRVRGRFKDRARNVFVVGSIRHRRSAYR